MALLKRRIAVLYLSYDGIGEPLGHSQVLLPLGRLARDADVALISFEKPGTDLEALARVTHEAGIEWQPLPYRRVPPVLSTLFDIGAGVAAVRRRRRLHGCPDLVHARSYVPALMGLLGARGRVPLLFDIRGFWVDERVEGGLWRAGGALYRTGKRVERLLFRRADAVVTLTHASVPQIREWLGGRRGVPIVVIPTCAELDVFGRPPREEPTVVWAGSIGTWYRFDLAVRVARATGRPIRVLTRETEQAREALGGIEADVREVPPSQMPDELREGDIGLCLVRPSFSKTASAPTRLAEYLAAGMPVAVTPGVGDLETLVERSRIGVVIRDESDEAVQAAADRLCELAADPEARERCRRVARERFSLESGAEDYLRLYERLAG